LGQGVNKIDAAWGIHKIRRTLHETANPENHQLNQQSLVQRVETRAFSAAPTFLPVHNFGKDRKQD